MAELQSVRARDATPNEKEKEEERGGESERGKGEEAYIFADRVRVLLFYYWATLSVDLLAYRRNRIWPLHGAPSIKLALVSPRARA